MCLNGGRKLEHLERTHHNPPGNRTCDPTFLLGSHSEQESKRRKTFTSTFLQTKAALMPKGRWLTHAAAHSDLEGLAAQLNPVLIQTFTPCVNPDLLCRLYVPQNKANPGRVVAFPRNEIRYNAPSVSWLSPASAELCRLPADQTGKSWTFRTASHNVKKKKKNPLKLLKFIRLHVRWISFQLVNINSCASI